MMPSDPEQSTDSGDSIPTDDRERRFGGVVRLWGQSAAERIAVARIAVVGLGGVGSWAVEALARCGCEQLTIVDLDHVSVSNANRQLHAIEGEFGKSKVDAMAQRVLAINPAAMVRKVDDFLTPENAVQVLADVQYIVDAVDQTAAKAAMVAHARDEGTYIVVCGGAGGRRDPGRLRVDDLARSMGDSLLASVRQILRRRYGFPTGHGRNPVRFGVDAVFSEEPMFRDESCESATPGAPLACGGFGSSVAVTASMGMRAAACVIERIARAGPAQQSGGDLAHDQPVDTA